MAKSAHREIITMESTESHYSFTTKKNKNNTKSRLELKKYDPVLRKHVLFREKKK